METIVEILTYRSMDVAGRVGYEYNYRVWMDDDMLSRTDEYILVPGYKNIIFEIRTNFIIKKNKTKIGDPYDHEIIDSEKLPVVLIREGCFAGYLLSFIWFRLAEYWMSLEEVEKLDKDAFDHAESQPSDMNVIPIVVDLDVCTVQQEGEAIEDTRERAIWSKHLAPLDIYLFRYFRYDTEKEKNMAKYPMFADFLRRITKIRVANVEEGLGLMKVCSICLKAPTIGTQISSLSNCGHAFHNHCLLGFLEHDNLCPTCRCPAYDPYYMFH